MSRFKIIAVVESKKGSFTHEIKGFYYQGKDDIVLVGDVEKGHTIRRKLKIKEVTLKIDLING